MRNTDYRSYHDHNDGDDVDIEDDDAHAVPETHPLQPPGCSVTFLARPTQSITRKLFSNVNHRNVSKSQYWSHICRASQKIFVYHNFYHNFQASFSLLLTLFSTYFYHFCRYTSISEEFFVPHTDGVTQIWSVFCLFGSQSILNDIAIGHPIGPQMDVVSLCQWYVFPIAHRRPDFQARLIKETTHSSPLWTWEGPIVEELLWYL